ncbi:MAG: ABC transporter substrate-binding protein [Candidatus Omnitrophota bacterium]
MAKFLPASFFFAILLIFTTLPLFAAENVPLKKTTFMTLWVPQAQFAGFYAAQRKGIYKKYGLDVTILHGGPSRSPYDFLESGRSSFAMLWLATGIEKRAQGAKIVNVAQLSQKSALMLVAKKESGIKEPKDLEGKKVGLWDEIYQVQPRAFFEKFGLHVKVVPQSYSVNMFLRGGVDAASAMWFNEYHTILASGMDTEELTTIFFSDHSLNFPEDGIYALEATLAKDPELATAFVKASLEGWKYAFDNPEESLAMVMRNMKEAHVPASFAHQKWMLERMKDLMLPAGGNRQPGTLSKEDYMRTGEVLKKSGLIALVPPFGEFYKSGEASHEG